MTASDPTLVPNPVSGMGHFSQVLLGQFCPAPKTLLYRSGGVGTRTVTVKWLNSQGNTARRTMLCFLRTSSTSCGGACRFPIDRSRLQALDAGRSPLPPRDAPGPRSPSQTLHVSCIHGLPRKDRLGIRHEKSLGVFLAIVPG